MHLTNTPQNISDIPTQPNRGSKPAVPLAAQIRAGRPVAVHDVTLGLVYVCLAMTFFLGCAVALASFAYIEKVRARAAAQVQCQERVLIARPACDPGVEACPQL